MSQFTWAIKSKRHQGTYKVIPKVDWTVLLARDFGHPNWAALYPLNAKGQPVGILTPRMACKLFHDGVFIIKKGEESPKYVQDRIPDNCHKCFKKKQWRKQFFEAMRRVCCRLALGKGFRPNCVAEDVFIHAILGMSFELGWRRIESHLEGLPESDADKDFTRVTRLGANDEIGSMIKSSAAAAAGASADSPAPSTKKSKATSAAISNAKLDVKSWFQCYELSEDHLFDHIVNISEEETDDWSVNTGSTANTANSSAEPRERTESNMSALSTDGPALGVGSPPSSPIRSKIRSMSSGSSYSVERLYPGIGVPVQKGKARSNSAISALSTDEFDAAHHAAGTAPPTADMASLSFNETAPAAVTA